MSDTKTQLARHAAVDQAAAFKHLIEPYCERVKVVGSLRRGRPTVGDLEYVVIPRFEERPGGGLFGAEEPELVNLLWSRLDELVESGEPAFDEEYLDGWPDPEPDEPYDECEDMEPTTFGARYGYDHWEICKALRGNPPKTCWGPKLRAVHFRGMTHEIYTADADNWGSMVLIRTGPADFSRWVVTELQKHGLRHKDGRVVDTTKADPDHTGANVIPTPTEQRVFELIGTTYRKPKDRVGVDPDRDYDRR